MTNLEYPDDGLIEIDGKPYLSLDSLELWITNLMSTIENESFDCKDKEQLSWFSLYSIKDTIIKLQIELGNKNAN